MLDFVKAWFNVAINQTTTTGFCISVLLGVIAAAGYFACRVFGTALFAWAVIAVLTWWGVLPLKG